MTNDTSFRVACSRTFEIPEDMVAYSKKQGLTINQDTWETLDGKVRHDV